MIGYIYLSRATHLALYTQGDDGQDPTPIMMGTEGKPSTAISRKQSISNS